jgi:hypothetical protein
MPNRMKVAWAIDLHSFNHEKDISLIIDFQCHFFGYLHCAGKNKDQGKRFHLF